MICQILFHKKKLLVLVLALFSLLLSSCHNSPLIDFSADEIEWLKKNGKDVEVLFGYEAPPNAFHDADGNYTGLLVDFLGEIEKQVGISFVYRNFKEWDDLMHYALKADNFIIVGIASTETRSTYLSFTDSFFKVPYVIVTRESTAIRSISDLVPNRFCTVPNHAVDDYLVQFYPRLKPDGVHDNLAGLRAVSTGKYDAMIINQMYASYIIEQQGFTNLVIVGESGYLNRLSAATSTNDPVLFAILDKAVDRIPDTTSRKLYKKWLGQSESSLPVYTLVVVVGIIFLISVVALVFWIWNQSLKKQVIKKTEDIAKSRETLRTILHSMGDGVISVDVKGEIIAINKTASLLTGWPEQEALHQPLEMVFSPFRNHNPYPQEHPFAKRIDFGTTTPPNGFSTLVARDGREFKIAESVALIEDYGDNTAGTVIVFRDITEQKRLEEEDAKVEKLKSIGTLAGGIAHDFNNIFMGLWGNISLAIDDLPDDHPALYSLRAAESSLNRATRLTKQLLTFAQGGVPVREVFDFKSLVTDVVHFSLAGSAVLPVITCPDDLWFASADSGQMQQVFTNLIVNAKEAMPDGGRLHITLANQKVERGTSLPLNAGSYLKIVIADSGIGIKPEHLSRIFDPYFTTKQTGSGLGLATVYSVIAKHNGYIFVESGKGDGAIFTVYIPAVSRQAVEKEIVDQGQLKSFEDITVLVMDDEQSILNLVTRILQKQKIHVDTAEDGQKAINIYREKISRGEVYDLVILDLTVPGGLGGVETAKQILESDPQARLIVSSGYSEDPILSNPSEYGFVDIIAKPYSRKELLEVVSRVANL